MALPFKDNPYYKMSTLNKWFAATSIILLLTVVWALANDFFRDWKGYQRNFRNLEVERTRAAFKKEQAALELRPEYKSLQEKLKAARGVLDQKSSALKEAEDQLKALEAKNYRFSQAYNFAKAEFDVAKYHLEDAGVHGGDDARHLEKVQKKMDQAIATLETKRKVKEDVEDQIAEVDKTIEGFKKEISEIEKEQGSLAKAVTLHKRKLSKIDFAEMTLGNKLGDLFRNMPMVDFLSPGFRIHQVVIKDITDDVKYMKVPKVDRCITCHQGMNNPIFEDAANPYKTHPRLDLFLTSGSPHPVEEFGCTVCHGGRGRGTEFSSVVHTPENGDVKKQWEKDHGYEKLKLWEEPMYPMQYVEAGCFQCHSNETRIQGADRLSLGLALIEKAGCYGCHTIQSFSDLPKRGPDLTKIAAKDDKDWVFRWIKNPKGFRHTTWMPSFFNQTNSSDEEAVKRNDQEIHSIVHYLWENSEKFSVGKWPGRGNAKRGKELIASVGCFACHQEDPSLTTRAEGLNAIRRQHGPNLTGLGSKTTADWIYQWLKNPSDYSEHTQMPDLRLTDQEAADITAHLISGTHDDFMKTAVPPVDEAMLDKMIMDNLSRLNTVSSAKRMLDKMDLNQKLSFTGEKMVSKYGCFGCHDIKGFEKTLPIGAELTKIGSKDVHKFDFGYEHFEHSNYGWLTQKLKNPRLFDRGFVRGHDDKLKMPNFNFSDSEIEAVVTALLSFKKETALSSKWTARTVNNQLVAAGQKVVQKFNCQGCHVIEGDGGAIQPAVTDWLMTFQGKDENDAKAMTNSFSPPNLVGEGKKVRTEWLYHFMSDPQPIRPWLKVRMPTFNMSNEEKNTIVKYFSALDEEDFPFAASGEKASSANLAAGKKLFSPDYLNCGTCHIQGSKFPAGTPDRWAPDFALAKDRLKPEWIVDWLINPISLLPGTKMPSFYDPENMDESGPPDVLGGKGLPQIVALRDYVISIK